MMMMMMMMMIIIIIIISSSSTLQTTVGYAQLFDSRSCVTGVRYRDI
jgi:hypothetical protein